MNFITLTALGAAIVIVAMGDSKDEEGRSLWARFGALDFTANDRTMFKLVGIALAVAFVSHVALGAG